MEGNVLRSWLKKLQDEFVLRMSAIDAEVAAAKAETDDEDMEGKEEYSDGSRTRETTQLSSHGAHGMAHAAAEDQSCFSDDPLEDQEDVASYTDSTVDFTYMIKD